MTEEDLKEFPQTFIVCIAVILVVLMLAGLLCNLIVLVVYHISKKNRINVMDSASTGGKTFSQSISSALITNLNVVDVLIGLTALPITLYYVLSGRYHSPLFCVGQEAAISFVTSASALNLLVITLDRYNTIISPFQRKFKVSNIRWVFVLVWALSLFGLCVPFFALVTSRWTVSGINSTTFPCFALADSSFGTKFYFEIYYVLIYCVANIVIIVCYTRIFCTTKVRINMRVALIKAATVHLQAGTNEPSMAVQKCNERQLTKMTLMIVLTFMICWAPHAMTSLATMIVETTYELEMLQIMCVTLAYSATLQHPLLYAFMRRNFREAFRDSLNRRTPTGYLAHVKHSASQASSVNTAGRSSSSVPSTSQRQGIRKSASDNVLLRLQASTLSTSTALLNQDILVHSAAATVQSTPEPVPREKCLSFDASSTPSPLPKCTHEPRTATSISMKVTKNSRPSSANTTFLPSSTPVKGQDANNL